MTTISKTVYLGCCFLTLFSTYVTTQTFLTAIFDDFGYVIFALIYAPYAAMSLVSPFVGKKIGVKASLVIAASTYVAWTVAVASQNRIAVIVASLFNGFGCGLLWVHQGIYLNHLIKSSDYADRTGFITGIFFAIYSANICFGGILALLLAQKYSLTTTLWVLASVCGSALIGFVLLPKPSDSKSQIPESQTNSSNQCAHARTGHEWRIVWNFLATVEPKVQPEPETKTSLSSHFTELKKSFLLAGFRYLIPIYLLVAQTIVFSYAVLPALVKKDFEQQNVPDGTKKDFSDESFVAINKLFIVYGFFSALCAHIWGATFDQHGTAYLLAGTVVMTLFQFVTLLTQLVLEYRVISFSWYVRAGIAAATDSSLVALANMSISHNYTATEAPFLFALYRFFYCATFALCSLLNLFISPITYSVLVLMTTGITIGSVFHFSTIRALAHE
jgi:MFS family permease